jgi:endoglucanase
MKKKTRPVILIAIAIIIGVIVSLYLFVLPDFLAIHNRSASLKITKELSNGINIGNDLDVCRVKEHLAEPTVYDYETFWHNTPVTKEVFAAVKDAGFNCVRLPVTWYEHVDEDYTIDEEWMARVKEAVDDALSCGLYVIIDTHHEEFIKLEENELETSQQRLVRVWEQIASEFKDYDEKLIFEGLNEPRLVGTDLEWSEGTPWLWEAVNRLNSSFVDTVRKSGGNNEKRFLMIGGYATSHRTEALKAIELPEKDYRIIVSVHAYIPYSFVSQYGKNVKWDSDSEYKHDIDHFASDLQEIFLDKHIPVVITEFGCNELKDEKERLAWAKYYTQTFSELGVPFIWWDEGSKNKIIDRETTKVVNEELVNIIVGQ